MDPGSEPNASLSRGDRDAAPPPLPRRRRSEPPPPRRSFWRRPIGVLCLVGAGVVVLGMTAIGVLLTTGVVPDTRVVSGSELPDRALQQMREVGALQPDEQVVYYYGAGLFSYLEDGNLLTGDGVVSYWREGDEVVVARYAFEEIADVEVEWGDGILRDTEILVHGDDDGELLLYLSTERRGDRSFHSSLMTRWRRARPASAGGDDDDGR